MPHIQQQVLQNEQKEFDSIVLNPNTQSQFKIDRRKWLDIARKHRRHHPKCAVCGVENNIEIHHIIPLFIDSSKAYDVDNLISLCRSGRNCHLTFGHLGNFNNWNPDILKLKKY